MLKEQTQPHEKASSGQADWPAEVDFILSALEAGHHGHVNRRRLGRMRYRVAAELRLFSDPEGTAPWKLYTRDVNRKGLGFITCHRLPLGYGGRLHLPNPEGRLLVVECTLLRCREAVPGWFEGAVYFNREQMAFAMED